MTVETKKFMSGELKTLLKDLAIKMIDAMELWGNKDQPKGAKPTWAEKEHAMTEYLSSRPNMEMLLGVIAREINSMPEEQEAIGLVTKKFVIATFSLLEEYMNIEFPKEAEQEAKPAEPKANEVK